MEVAGIVLCVAGIGIVFHALRWRRCLSCVLWIGYGMVCMLCLLAVLNGWVRV